MSDGPCHRCGAYGGYGCYECIPPEDIDRRISAEISRLNTTITELRKEVERLTEADDFAALVADARAEAEKAMRKFPQPNYVISKIAEEAGEVVKAAIHCAEGRETAENLRGEMKQVIAMLYRLWVEGDGVHGLPSVRAALQGETKCD